MKTKGVSEARANLSALLKEVRQGETIVITNRGVPVAQIVPYTPIDGEDGERINALVANGLLIPPRNRMDVEEFLATPRPKLPEGVDLSKYVIEEREESEERFT